VRVPSEMVDMAKHKGCNLPGQKYTPIIRGTAGMKAAPISKRHAILPVPCKAKLAEKPSKIPNAV
jgi:hypothetical protein